MGCREMEQFSEIDKSKLRISGLLLQHCCRYRLFDARQADIDVQLKLAVISEVLDRFEEELERLRPEGGEGATPGFEVGGGKERTRKQSVDYRRNAP